MVVLSTYERSGLDTALPFWDACRKSATRDEL